MKLKIKQIIFTMLLALSAFIAFVWFNLLFSMEQLIDPANIPDAEFVKLNGIMFGYSSSYLLAFSIVPTIIIMISIKAKETGFLFVLRKISIVYFYIALLLSVLQIGIILAAGEKYV
jgi:hypothetical protein